MHFDTACAHLRMLGYRKTHYSHPDLGIIPFTHDTLCKKPVSIICYCTNTYRWYVPFNTSTINHPEYAKLARLLNGNKNS